MQNYNMTENIYSDKFLQMLQLDNPLKVVYWSPVYLGFCHRHLSNNAILPYRNIPVLSETQDKREFLEALLAVSCLCLV